jgi:hypothetical protein
MQGSTRKCAVDFVLGFGKRNFPPLGGYIVYAEFHGGTPVYSKA